MPPLVSADELLRNASEADEVELRKLEAPTETVPAGQKRVLWEDRGDHVVISLPKERITTPAGQTGSPAYATAYELAAGLAAIGTQSRVPTVSTSAGNVTGRVLRDGQPLADCRLRLSPVVEPTTKPAQTSASAFPEESSLKALETTTGSDGIYLFERVPTGNYDILWLAPGSAYWQGWLSAEPDVAVKTDATIQQSDVGL
jgi:hypothetical protein